jgi:glutamyl-tRNA reductase
MESMVFGEHEILGQIRDAYFHCFREQATDSYLNRLFHQAIATGKEVRSKTMAGRTALSVVSIAMERMDEIAGDLREKNIMIVGMGAMGLRVLKRLANAGPATIAVSNRTTERALQFCAAFHARHVPFGAIVRELSGYDIVILATSSQRHILTAADIGQRVRPLLVIDLGAPRNVDPEVGTIEQTTLISVDDLRATAEARMAERKGDRAEMDAIIERQIDEFKRWYRYKSGCECDGR